MPTTPNSIITPQTPMAAVVNMSAVTACTTRGPTAVGSAAGANIVQATATVTTNGCRIDRIYVKGSSTSITATSAAQTVIVWLSDGTTLWPFDEILVTAVVPSTTVASYQGFNNYTGLVLPSAWSLWLSTTVTTTAATTALVALITGAAL